MPKRITTKEKEHLQDLKNNIKMLKEEVCPIPFKDRYSDEMADYEDDFNDRLQEAYDELTDFQRKLFEKYGRNY